jgi:hypothetical protein
MKRLVMASLGLFLLGACAQTGQWTVGGPRDLTLLVMGEDADTDSIARDNRAFTRVLDEIAAALSAHGFRVYDETAVTLDTHGQGRVRRPISELIDVARGVRSPPIDTIALFTIYAQTTKRPYTDKLNLRVGGRLIGVQDGRFRGSFEARQQGDVRPNCSAACRDEAIGDMARVLAQDVGAILAEKLAAQAPARRLSPGDTDIVKTFTLIFDDFSAAEMNDMEDYLVIFTGYRSHRPTTTLHRHFEIAYKSSIDEAKLQRNLTRMLEELDMRARIGFVGNEYTVRQIRASAGRRRVERNLDDW